MLRGLVHVHVEHKLRLLLLVTVPCGYLAAWCRTWLRWPEMKYSSIFFVYFRDQTYLQLTQHLKLVQRDLLVQVERHQLANLSRSASAC